MKIGAHQDKLIVNGPDRNRVVHFYRETPTHIQIYENDKILRTYRSALSTTESGGNNIDISFDKMVGMVEDIFMNYPGGRATFDSDPVKKMRDHQKIRVCVNTHRIKFDAANKQNFRCNGIVMHFDPETANPIAIGYHNYNKYKNFYIPKFSGSNNRTFSSLIEKEKLDVLVASAYHHIGRMIALSRLTAQEPAR